MPSPSSSAFAGIGSLISVYRAFRHNRELDSNRGHCHKLARRLFLVAAALVGVSFFAAAEEPIAIETEDTTTEGFAALSVRAFAGGTELKGGFEGAEVTLNRFRVGTTPYENSALKPGGYFVGVSKEGYYPREVRIVAVEKKRYEIVVPLSRMKGFLAITVSPVNATVLVDGLPKGAGLLELPSGKRKIEVKRFGYLSRRLEIEIAPNTTVFESLSLDLAPFTLSKLAASRPSFNPRNAGLLGFSVLSFEVSSWGSGRLELRSAEGRLVAEKAFPDFEEWDQEFVWNGRDEKGDPLPDGIYSARLEASPSPGPSGTFSAPNSEAAGRPQVRELEVLIDSSLIVEPYGASLASPGLLFFPDPRATPEGVLVLDIAYAASLASASLAGGSQSAGLAASFSTLSVVATVAGALELALSPGSSASFAASVLAPLLPRNSAFSAAVGVLAGYASQEGASPLMKAKAGFSGGLDLPFSVSLGPAHVGLAPGFEASLTKGGAFDAFGLSGKAGLWLSGPTFRLGASGKLGPTLSVADLPCAAALEGRIVLDPSPLVLWGSALVDFQFGTIGATRPSIPVFKLIGGLGLLM